MGLCYSLRPLLFGDSEDTSRAASETPAEGARPGPAPAPAAGEDAARTPVPRGAGRSPACSRPKADTKKERRGRPDQLRAEEREAEREARKVSRGIDRMLREQKRDLQRTHRLLLLGRCGQRRDSPGARELGEGQPGPVPEGSAAVIPAQGGRRAQTRCRRGCQSQILRGMVFALTVFTSVIWRRTHYPVILLFSTLHCFGQSLTYD